MIQHSISLIIPSQKETPLQALQSLFARIWLIENILLLRLRHFQMKAKLRPVLLQNRDNIFVNTVRENGRVSSDVLLPVNGIV